MTAPHWLRQRERSNTFWINTIVWIALHVGRPVARALLYPITAYFLVFSGTARAASRQYLARVLTRPPRTRDLFRHYHTFAQTLLDRLFVYAGRASLFRLDVRGFELLEGFIATGQPCLLVGAHYGSVDLLRTLAVVDKGLSIRALMYPENASRIMSLFRRINPSLSDGIIALGRPDTFIDVAAFLEAGGCVALLGDRSMRDEKRVACEFLGSPAWFPEAPARLARLFRVPLLLFACTHSGDAEYAVHFELLADFRAEPLPTNAEVVQQYARRLEDLCRGSPYNWFNFYDFWDGST
ncbi:LpxL/LpxP family acyltransferase [Methylotetracoccus oryzae]|uniref:LpxL/LpxP family acyltransferase n=1 Tax=Methylotetracoccus oryzae TaxID=1919059 RepID=UPI0011181A02|nr:lipid A biosynthesis acyltransferase [Methylotetracoccus oryzae]